MNFKSTSNLSSNAKIFAAFILLVLVISLLPGRIPYETVKEGGPIETLSAGGYFLFCLFALYFNWIKVVRTSMAPTIFMLLLGLRELDFHARFTTMGMFKIRFFISPEVPVAEKVVVSIFIIILVVYAVSFLRRVWPVLARALRNKRPYAVSIACGIACVLLSKFLDSNDEIFEWVFRMLDDPEVVSRTIEEVMELFIPVFFIRSLIQYSRETMKKRKT